MGDNNVNGVMEQEKGLKRTLTTRQISMIAIGGAIGTGLFLGSGSAIMEAGPSVIISYIIGAVVAMLLIGCLAEMTVANPTSGSFGVYADQYINSWAGFAVRYTYWFSLVCAIGTEVTAIGIYMKYWFPQIPGIVWIVMFGLALIFVNLTSVKMFGEVEYWFSFIKIVAIVGFIVLAVYTVFAHGDQSSVGPANYTNDGGFLPHGFYGMLTAAFVSLFSYLSIEMIAVSAGEAKDPDRAIPIALKSAAFRLIFFYLITLSLMLMIVPWGQAGTSESPFVKVMEIINIPGAAGIMNFVILVAALSAMNSQLYTSTRMMFSLSRAGYAPRKISNLNKKGIPGIALFLSTIGIIIATIYTVVSPETAFTFMISISGFCAMFAWFMIFITHLFFRKKWQKSGGRKLPIRMIGYPYLTIIGAVVLAVVVLSTWFSPTYRPTLLFGFPWLIFITIAYFTWRNFNRKKPVQTEESQKKTI